MTSEQRELRRATERGIRRGKLNSAYTWYEDSRAQRCVECDCEHDKALQRDPGIGRRPPVGTVFVGRRRYQEDGKCIIARTGPLCAAHAVQREQYRREKETSK